MDLLKVVIETSRLRIITNTDEKYAKDMFRELTPEIAEYLSFYPPKDISETLKFIKDNKAKAESGEGLVVIVLDKETGEFIGSSGIDTNSKTPETGIWLKKSAHRKGYGKEIIGALIDWANKNLDYEYILYPVAKDNVASRKLVESLGGVIAEEKMHTFASGKSYERIEYRIYRK